MVKLKPRIYAGVVWGLMTPTVILVAEHHPPPADRVHLMRELYRPECYLEDFIAIAQAWREELTIRKFFCDPGQPEFIEHMRKARLPAVAAPKGQDLARNMIKQRLAHTREGKPGGLTISRACPQTIAEFGRYHLQERRDKPAEGDTPGLRALHFLMLGLSLEATPRVRWL
jgi:hypothetical protein